jgi:hypothetical protein
VTASFPPVTGYHQMATGFLSVMASFLLVMANFLPATGYDQMATGFLLVMANFLLVMANLRSRTLYPRWQNPHCFPLRW